MSGEIIAYTDGGCFGNPGPGGWGVRIEYPDGGVMEFGGKAGYTTNNRMELLAAVQVLAALTDEKSRVIIHTDSRYLHDGFTSHLRRWKKNGWKTAGREHSSAGNVKNRDLWELLDKLAGENISWKWVRGHDVTEGNHRVDAIASALAKNAPVTFGYKPGDEQKKNALHSEPPPPSRSATPKATADFPCYISLVRGEIAIHKTWADCQGRTHGVSGAKFKKCRTKAEMNAILDKWGVTI